VRSWDPTNGSNQILDVFDFAAWSVDVSPDGLIVAATDETGNVRLLDPDSREEILPRLETVSGTVTVVFSPDGDLLAGGGSGGVVYIWNVSTGSIDRRLQGALGKPTPAFVNGGDELRSVGAEGIVRGYALDPLDLLEIARSQVDERMTEEECQQYLRRSCDS
jgi:WD40 repeat protein